MLLRGVGTSIGGNRSLIDCYIKSPEEMFIAKLRVLLPEFLSRRTSSHGKAQLTKICCEVEIVLRLAPGVSSGVLPALRLVPEILVVGGLAAGFRCSWDLLRGCSRRRWFCSWLLLGLVGFGGVRRCGMVMTRPDACCRRHDQVIKGH